MKLLKMNVRTFSKANKAIVNKSEMRRHTNELTQQFLSRGGEIQKLPRGQSGLLPRQKPKSLAQRIIERAGNGRIDLAVDRLG